MSAGDDSNHKNKNHGSMGAVARVLDQYKGHLEAEISKYVNVQGFSTELFNGILLADPTGANDELTFSVLEYLQTSNAFSYDIILICKEILQSNRVAKVQTAALSYMVTYTFNFKDVDLLRFIIGLIANDSHLADSVRVAGYFRLLSPAKILELREKIISFSIGAVDIDREYLNRLVRNLQSRGDPWDG